MIRFLVAAAAMLLFAAPPVSSASPTPMTLRNQAREAMNAQHWSEAAELYTQLVSLSPDDGALWRALGSAQLRRQHYDEAIAALARARAVGTAPAVCLYDTACAHALAGRRDAALAALRDAYAAGFADGDLVARDTDLESVRTDPRFRDITGLPDPAVTDRNARWSRDVDFLARRIRELHWRPFAVLPEAEFDAAVAGLRAAIPTSTDVQLRTGIRRLLASIGDGHTALVTDFFRMHHLDGATDLHFLPVTLFRYDDGVRVVAATAPLETLVGMRVTRIGGVDMEEVCARLDPLVSRDNDPGARWIAMQAAADPVILEELGLGDGTRGFEFELADSGGSRRTEKLMAGGPEALSRRRIGEITGTESPWQFREKSKPLWMQPLDGALYVRMDGVMDTHEESFAAFTERIFRTAADTGAHTLILDLRDNPGGQGQLTRPLLHRLIASETFNRPGGLYVLIGRTTFSAAMALAAQIEVHTAARFVGEPTGSRPNFVGETTLVTLPYSRCVVSISSRYHQDGESDDRRLWIPPDIPAAPSFDAERAGRDPAVEAVQAEMAAAR